MKDAIDQMLAGGPLEYARPTGKSRIPGGKSGRVYLSPAFGEAAEYAFRVNREDWPKDDDRQRLRKSGYVFVFEELPTDVLPDEDSIAHAARVALEMEQTGEASASAMNYQFDQRVRADAEFQSMLLSRLRQTPKAQKLIEGRHTRELRHALLVKLGNVLLDAMSRDEIEHTLSLGPSVSVSPGIIPTSAYRLERLVFDPSGLQAIPIEAPAAPGSFR